MNLHIYILLCINDNDDEIMKAAVFLMLGKQKIYNNNW